MLTVYIQAQQPPGLVSSRYTQAKAPQEPTHSRYRTGQSTLLYISNRSIGSHSASAGATTLYADLYTALSAIAWRGGYPGSWQNHL